MINNFTYDATSPTGLRWLARIWKNGKTYSGGFHRTFESAVAARVKLEEEHYGFTKD